jgi:alanine dehydrogenase
MSHLRNSVTTAMAVLLLATPLIAQSTTTLQDTTVVSALPASPAPASGVTSAVLIDRAPTAATTPSWMNATVVAPTTAQMSVARASDSGRAPQSTAMMIVGGAGLIVGAVVGGNAGTVFMVGGGIVGLLGLWNYLR